MDYGFVRNGFIQTLRYRVCAILLMIVLGVAVDHQTDSVNKSLLPVG